MRPLLPLLRFPNIFSAWADIIAGWLVANAAWQHSTATSTDWIVLGCLLVATTGLYWAGMVLNDYFDYQTDLVERPERPLPAGDISLTTAQRLGWVLLLVGIAGAAGAAYFSQSIYPLLTAGVLALALITYDAGLKNTHLGPWVMGTCRWLNLLLGMSTAAQVWPAWQLLLAAGPALYIVGVTYFAKGEAGVSSRAALLTGWLLLLAGLGLLYGVPRYTTDFDPVPKVLTSDWHFLWGALAVLLSFRCVRATADPTSGNVRRAVGQCLRSYILLAALLCFAVRDLHGALIVMSLLVPQLVTGRLFYAT